MAFWFQVYFVQSPFTRNFQNSWVCGGAIVTPTQILTSAACLIEAENIYAIAGYKKYITAENIDRDECTRAKKQRVVKIFIPTGYNLDYENPAQPKNINIGVAVVEKPYNFSDFSYLIHCSYEPQPILVNFENIHDIINSRAVTLGWGVRGKTPEFRKETKYQLLQETSTMVVDKKICTSITDTKQIHQLINKYHLCGTINLQEVTEDSVFETLSFDAYKHRGSGSKRGNSGFKDIFGYRRGYNEEDNSEPRDETENITLETRINMNNKNNYGTRKAIHPNICQNNLGSPLIKWIHDREVIIGITSNTNINGECDGPFLYVSTAASSKIIKCLLETNPLTRMLCNKRISDEPYEIQEIDIMWPNYNQSKILEPMLLVQRAVLDKLSPLIPRATIKYTKQTYTRSIKKFNAEQSLNPLKGTAINQNIYKRAQAPQRTQLRPLLSRPQYDIDVKYQKEQKQKEQQYIPVSEELSPTEYFAKLFKPQFPPLLQRPQFDIDVRYQEEHDEAVSNEFASTQQEFLRPQYNLHSDQQYQPLKNEREFKPDYQQEYSLSENQKHQSPSYNQQHSPQQHQNNEPIQEEQFSLIREQFNPELMQIYGSPTEEHHNSLIEHPYYPPSPSQEREPLVRLQHKLATIQVQYEPQPGQSHAPPLDVKYNPLHEYQNKPSPKQQHEPQLPVQHDLTARQEHSPVYGPSQSEQHNIAVEYHQLHKQSEPLDNPYIYQPPTQISGHSLDHDSMENNPIKLKLKQPELLYDFSPELHFGKPDLTPNQPQKSAQSPISLQKPPAQFSKSQPNSQLQTSQLESPYQKLLAQNNTTTLSDDDSFSFDEIFAQLQNLPSESQTTARYEQTQKQIFEQVLQDRTFDEPYKENNQQHDMYPRVEIPL
ncbi:unnamed protein product [Arctia plantaginis]|uniref:Peptidase S1 domain-containing protein n=1 Tax=Arctia plantaginis TaxID=874455 RepID=A0A8S1BEW8_ARCPL|nr:unnamed protein product [Arctia plantaginis]